MHYSEDISDEFIEKSYNLFILYIYILYLILIIFIIILWVIKEKNKT